MNKKIQCPCCQNYTISNSDEIIVDICEVCYWQYDLVSQCNPTIAIGPNKVSLNEARENYKKFGVSNLQLKEFVREPLESELPKKNKRKKELEL